MSKSAPLDEFLDNLQATEGALQLAKLLVSWFREAGPKQAPEAFTAFLECLQRQPELASHLAHEFCLGLQETHIYPALVTLGIFSRRGFTREFISRLYDRVNPAPRDLDNLKDVLGLVFDDSKDALWFATLPRDAWLQVFQAIHRYLDVSERVTLDKHFYKEGLHALEMLSIWVAAEELEPDLMRLDKRLIELDSPLVALQREMQLMVASAWKRLEEPEYPLQDPAHLWVMLDQSHEQVARLRRRGAGSGSSVGLAHLLERLDQTLNRMQTLLKLLTSNQPEEKYQVQAKLIQELVEASIEKKGVRSLWQNSTRMLSRSITQNKSDHGEHYIAKDRKNYWALIKSAAGAGLIIALMAWIKIMLESLGLSRGVEALLVSLNYGLGFVLVHLLHFTIATKQPAMTAASFAAEVEKGENARASNRKLADLLIDVNRSQWAAVWGNVSTAILLAMGLSLLSYWLLNQPLLTEQQVAYQLSALAPITGLALFYAAIAGVWLFCSGILAGFFDNRADYLELRLRLRYHPLMVKLFSERHRERLADYLHDNYGALAGNFLFGVLLGMTGYLGYLTGLPLDIRHVAFSSANLGYASISGSLGVLEFLLNLLWVLMIGFVNLWVSFSLALSVALKARGTQISSFRELFSSLGGAIAQQPLAVFFPVALMKAGLAKNQQPTAAEQSDDH
ncbi:Site-specific recombinase [Marinospirillum celere]|uniref:Site-specific recombinase n=1 Tax=Marinospirillum celere TaxID=1122252 RepID=A0A1I1DVE6_9GAMM|nr:site-specific recombinase [Marinospirillum celere]SFB78925.1 Site-specific recombinase [Marinospirillum celere]